MRIKLAFLVAVLFILGPGLTWAQLVGPGIDVGDDSTVPGGVASVALDYYHDAGDATTNLNFTITYVDTVFDEAGISIDCSAGIAGLTSLTCSVDMAANEIRGIGIPGFPPEPLEEALGFATITLPVLGNAPLGPSSLDISASFFDEAGTNLGVDNSEGGTVTILGPAYASTPPPQSTLDIGTWIQNDGPATVGLNITNDGAAGSTLAGECAITSDPSGVFEFLGTGSDGPFPIDVTAPDPAGQQFTFACDTSAAFGPYAGEVTCTHNGDEGGAPSPVTYGLACNITEGPQPEWGSSPQAPGQALPTLGPVEQNDPNPAPVVLTVTNTSTDGGTMLSGTCTAGAPFLVTGGSVGPLAEGNSSQVSVTCDATAAVQTHNGTLSCDHNGSNGPNASYPLVCIIDPPGLAIYQSTPAPGAVPLTPGGDVLVDSDPPAQLLTISNGADPGDQDLNLIGCDWSTAHEGLTADPPIGGDLLAPGGGDTATTTFSCDTSTAGQKSGTYSCEYNRGGIFAAPQGDGDGNEIADYLVTCGVRDPESDVVESPGSGTPLTMFVAPGGTGFTSVAFTEIIDEGATDASLDNCFLTNEDDFDIVSPAGFSVPIPSGGSVEVEVSGTDPALGQLLAQTDLVCTYSDSDDEAAEVSWTITLNTQIAEIPTISDWGRMLMILTLFGLGAAYLRRRVFS